MKSFKNTLLKSIERGTYTKEYYQEVVAKWLIHGWLTEDEAEECMAAIEARFPEEPEVNSTSKDGSDLDNMGVETEEAEEEVQA